MCQHSRPVKPQALGMLGGAHLTDYLVTHWGVERDSVRYRKATGEQAGVPFAWEVAFGIYRDGYRDPRGRASLVGLNWSPALQPPIRELTSLLGEQRVDSHDPVVLIVHLACPVVPFTDRAKSVVDLAGRG